MREEFLEGFEASIFAFCDGKDFVSTIFSQDHKPVFDGDNGPNTGGMGAYAPVKKATKYKNFVDDQIFTPILKGMSSEGIEYKGILFAGLMITNDGPKVIEFNCRFGDPETQVVLPLMKNDLVEICEAIISQNIKDLTLEWKDAFAVDVVAVAKGYPVSYNKGMIISIGNFDYENSHIFYAGVDKQKGKLVAKGGRVLAVSSIATTLKDAINLAYNQLSTIHFDDIYYRSDIAQKGLTND